MGSKATCAQDSLEPKAKLMSMRFWKKFVVNYRFHRSLGTVSRWRSCVEAWRSAGARSPQVARRNPLCI
jgi:hypothetical protein